MEAAKIVLLCVVSAITYGILHDQVTARVCVQYFTIGHPPVFATQSPTLLAIGWGIIATWWVGLMLGVPGAVVCRAGKWPKLAAQELVRPIAALLLVMGFASIIAGAVGFAVANSGGVFLLEPLASRVPQSRHVAFIADLWAHSAAYGIGFLGGMILWGWVLYRRSRLAYRSARPS